MRLPFSLFGLCVCTNIKSAKCVQYVLLCPVLLSFASKKHAWTKRSFHDYFISQHNEVDKEGSETCVAYIP